MQGFVECCFTSTETVGLLGTGAQDGHLDFHTAPVDVKHHVYLLTYFTATSTREIHLCARPASQLTRSLLLPANRVFQSIAHARRYKLKGSTVSSMKQDISIVSAQSQIMP